MKTRCVWMLVAGLLSLGCVATVSGTDEPESTEESILTVASAQNHEPGWDDDEEDKGRFPRSHPVLLRSRIGPTGVFEVHDDVITGMFFVDDTILHASDAPHCLAWLRSTNKPPIRAGVYTVGGTMIGEEWSLAAPLNVPWNDDYFQYLQFLNRPPVMFQQGTPETIKVSLSDTPLIPGLPVTTLHSAGFPLLTVLKPTLDENFNLIINSRTGLDVTWIVPPAASTERVGVTLTFLFGPGKVGEVRCGARVRNGKTKMPASLLTAVKQRLSPDARIEGAQFRVSLGDQREVRVNAASYYLEVSPTTHDGVHSYGTTFGELLGAMLE